MTGGLGNSHMVTVAGMVTDVTFSPHDLIQASVLSLSPSHRGQYLQYMSFSKEVDARYEWPSEIKIPVFSQIGVKLKCLIKV